MTQQHPIGSGFGPHSTAEEIVRGRDLSGRTAIVTGGYSGLGREVTRVLAEAGCSVIVPVRDAVKAEANLAGIARVETRPLDLLDPGSIRSFTEDFVAEGRALDLLINSAAIMASPLMRDARGFEAQFSINHLGHFQLTVGLWRSLEKAGGARIVAFSSRGHFLSPMLFDDPNFERTDYDPVIAYGQSKTANVLFALEADRRGRDRGIRAYSLHPGMILTDLARYMPPEVIRQFDVIDDQGNPIIDPDNDKKTVSQGAATALWCATSPSLAEIGGVYCEDSDIAAITTADDAVRGVRPWACDPAAAERLWRLSEKLTGATL